MSNAWWWSVMAGWGLIAGGTICWIWHQTGKADRALEAQLNIDYDALFEMVGEELGRQQDLQKDAAVPVPGDLWLERARRAEALGWLDDNDPKRVA